MYVFFSLPSWAIILTLGIIILKPSKFILIMKTYFEHYCLILSNNIDQNSNKIGGGFPPTSGQIHPTSGLSDWPN